MKTIGMLGGTAWPSTIDYYRYLNRLSEQKYGARHSARVILYSIDYEPILKRYRSDWDAAVDLFEIEFDRLVGLRPDCIVVCCNTLHRVIDELGSALRCPVPLIHMVEETAREAVALGIDRVLLLGTQFTMENGYYADLLEASGVVVDIPAEQDRQIIQVFQTAAASGKSIEGAAEYFSDLLTRHGHNKAAVLACTELPQLFENVSTEMTILDPLRIQCDAAFEFAIAE